MEAKNQAYHNLEELNQKLVEAKQQLEDYSKNLELKVEERTSELKKAKDELIIFNQDLETKVKKQVDKLERYNELRRYLSPNITEKILGKTIEEIKNLGDETLTELNKHLFCKLIRLRGNALGDEFGPTIIAREAELIEFDFNKEYDQLFRDLEDLQ